MQIVIVVHNGVVTRVIADSDLQYRVVDLDEQTMDEDLCDAELSQMEDEDESYAVAAAQLD